MPITYEPIATTTLSSNQATVTFSNIPGTYTDLVVVYNGTNSDSNAGVRVQFNSNTSAILSRTSLNGFASAGSSREAAASTVDLFFGTTDRTIGIANIMNYSNTTTNKTVLVRDGAGAAATRASVILWANTSAITSISMFREGGPTIASGSTFTLYGIKAA